MKENIGHPGMPPLYIDVVGRVVHRETPTVKDETIYIRGIKPGLGRHIEGYTGVETECRRTYMKNKNGEWRVEYKPFNKL